MKKKLLILFLCIAFLPLLACEKEKADQVIIYSCLESFRNVELMEQLKKELPEIDVTIESLSTGKLAAKLKSEGSTTEGDIIIGVDTSYVENLKEHFETLENFNYDRYLEEFQISDKKYAIWERYSGCIVVNTALLSEKNLPIPQSYDDLLNPIYQNLIVMPDPKASATGYLFLKNLANEMGNEGALDYFDELAENIIFFTASGSGPVNLLIQGEAAIGLGMTFHAVQEINQGMPFSILYFEEGAPYNTSSFAMLKNRNKADQVKAVFTYLYDHAIIRDKELFSPEKIFKNQDTNIENYPENIPYGNMKGINNIEEKEILLNEWKY